MSDSGKSEEAGNGGERGGLSDRLTCHPGDGENLLGELRAIVDEQVVATYSWYRRHARIPRLLFRASGALVILLSISLPFLSSMDYPQKPILLSVVALIIAALTGLSSFFAWEQTWKSRRQTEFALAHLLAQWEVRLAAAKHESDPEKKRLRYIESTEQLLVESRAVVASETEEFFSTAKWPQGKPE